MRFFIRSVSLVASVALVVSAIAQFDVLSLARADETQALSRDAFRKLHNEFREQMSEDLTAAEKFLEAKIKEAPESADLQVFRESLASKLLADEQYAAATIQVQRLLDFQIKHVDQTEHQYGIGMTIQAFQQIADESGDSKALDTAVQRGLTALLGVKMEKGFPAQIPIAQLTVLKAHAMVADDKLDEAKELVSEQFVRLSKINSTESASETTMQAQLRMMRALADDDPVNDAWRDFSRKAIADGVEQAIKKYPESLRIQNEYADAQFLLITRWEQDDAEATKKRLESTTKTLAGFAIKNPAALATLRRLQVQKERLESAKPVETLVGKPAPAWDVDGTVNTEDDVTQDSLKGKVVLLDFWAMWCGPCIATFPHLQQWREEYGDQGFEIVGVTQYYNYEWDEEKKRASRAKEEVSGWAERDTLKSFLDHHQLKHPVIVTPKDSKMSSDYGVRGIPHVVLIDQEGVVQLVKTGAGKATAEAIEAKIKELLK